jgi:hypothetical protein
MNLDTLRDQRALRISEEQRERHESIGRPLPDESPLSDDEEEVAARLAPQLPITEDDAHLVINGRRIPITLRVYGDLVPRFAGDRETPEEGAGLDITKVTIGALGTEIDIAELLDTDDIGELEAYVLEAIGEGT